MYSLFDLFVSLQCFPLLIRTYADVALKQLIKTNPAVGALVDKLNLKPIEAFSYGPEN